MEKQKFCRYCSKEIPRKGNRIYYCSEWCCRRWHYEAQEELFYTPGVKQEKCIVCGKALTARQLKYCSRTCSGRSRYNRSKMIGAEMVTNIKKI